MNKLEVRVARVEREMDEVRELASGAHEDVATVQATLRAHISSLEALHENQREMQTNIVGLRHDVDGLRHDVGGLRHHVDTGFAEMREGFTTINLGMAQITTLLTIATGTDTATD